MLRPHMHPEPGSRVVHYCGDRIHFHLRHPHHHESGWKAFLRTNLTRADRAREEIIALAGARSAEPDTFAGVSWRDIPLSRVEDGWQLDFPLTDVGFFRAKAYCVDPSGCQHWPNGEDVGISVHPDHIRTGNTIYCAFPRMFGVGKAKSVTRIPALEEQLRHLDDQGYSVIPPSGKLRELAACVPHIIETLGCRVLHLLPLGPTPTTYARMGRFGSPYAQLDMEGIDPALVELDKKTTAEDQFRELAYGVHLRGGLVFLDIVINHTGWGSRLMQEHPEWFKKNTDGTFHSPGAWGNTWGDLVELDNHFPELWEVAGKSLLTWCRRGVDGFRCDAGYMVPVPAWQYLIARVRQEFPDTVFLLEGLGGAWSATEGLLTEGGMQWAYSELFQNYSPMEVSGYLDHTIQQSQRIGPLVHYSETHDNDRLAKRGKTWSLLRNRLCALTSVCGGFGFTSGVEWLASEKIEVHQARGLAWDSEPNLVPELAKLQRLIKDHPCFFDGAVLERLSADDSQILALGRHSQEGVDHCLVLINLDLEKTCEISLSQEQWQKYGNPNCDLLDQETPAIAKDIPGRVSITMESGATFCLAASHVPSGLHGDRYRAKRAQADWAYRCLAEVLPVESIGRADWRELAGAVSRDPFHFLASLQGLDKDAASVDLMQAIRKAMKEEGYPAVIRWQASDLNRQLCVPLQHWLFLSDPAPFEVTLQRKGHISLHLRSIPFEAGHMASISPSALELDGETCQDAELILDLFKEEGRRHTSSLRLLCPNPTFHPGLPTGVGLLTNGRGGMARVHANLGQVDSKYDCMLGANLHPDSPCDRHILIKRMRAWVNADGFLTAMDDRSILRFEPGPPIRWVFLANAGDGRAVEIHLSLHMVPDRNTVVARFTRPSGDPIRGMRLPEHCNVRISLRLDLEDRGFHFETQACPEATTFFQSCTTPMEDKAGFVFAPGPNRTLRVHAPGVFHTEPEWSLGIWHALESTRGLKDQGDAWSPGWFEFDLAVDATVELIACADPVDPSPAELAQTVGNGQRVKELIAQLPFPKSDSFGRQLFLASSQFLAKRGEGSTVIAGYPWFLDWGRDTLIACRGLLAGGFHEEVRTILLTFARFEDRGTLPNMLSADSTANRDTSDAPLWFGLACEEAVKVMGPELLETRSGGRKLREVLESIAKGYVNGTPNGIKVDMDSGLVWSPSHFTWMDTNYPAGTPREGYPIEIQALWIRLLRQLKDAPWEHIAVRAEKHLDQFWCEDMGCFSDTLLAHRGISAMDAIPDGHLRPNQLQTIALGLVHGKRARRIVEACERHLLVPGAMRSLACLPVKEPLPIRGTNGERLNDPHHPYQGRYFGDEDTQRKPAYHNGTAWNFLLPPFCESLVIAYDESPEAVQAAKAYLASAECLLHQGCLGQLPEIMDGDAPHTPRGCDAQAWSVTEALRVWKMLHEKG